MLTPATRPQASAPIVANIPAELTARAQWVVWRYELRGDKWKKVPYTPGTTRKALSNRPSTWGAFPEALDCYRARPDFFDGIGYMFAKDDPYVGGDFDHCLSADGVLSDFAQQHLPATYAEISPSGSGIKFIARATLASGRKTAQAELYTSGRFFTITGNVLLEHTTITEAQGAIDALLAALPGKTRAPREGSSGSGSRAEQAAQVPEAEWEAARRLMRTGLDRLLRRLKAAAGGEETQLAYLLRGDYAGFHRKWPFVGLYRADGSLDDSQVRAVAANGIKGRGFSFPEYVALMSHLYAAQALAKWGTKARWREELAALWDYAQAPRYAPRPRPASTPAPKAPRGRAGNHQALVEQVYALLVEHRAGDAAIVQIGDLADVIYCHRRTISTILDELRAAGRITTKRLGQYGGLVVTFSDVIYSAAPEAAQPAATPETAAPTAPLEETKANCVSSETREADHILPAPTLRDLAAHYLSTPAPAIGRRTVCEATGQVIYRRTAQHFAELVLADYGGLYGYDAAIEAYRAERAHRKMLARQEWERFFKRLKAMSDDALIAYIGGQLRADVAALARDETVFDKHLYRTRLRCAGQQLEWRGLTMPARKTTLKPAAPRCQTAQVSSLPRAEQVSLFNIAPPLQPAAPAQGTPASLFAALRAIQGGTKP